MIAPTRSIRTLRLAAVLCGGLVLVGCSDSPSAPSDPPPELDDGLLATFRSSGEVFHVHVTSPEGMEQVLDLQEGRSLGSIPVGPILRGAGLGDHNGPWSWHFDPEEFRIGEFTIELCDGRPSYVEADLDYWVDNVGAFCPWGAELVEVVDLRR